MFKPIPKFAVRMIITAAMLIAGCSQIELPGEPEEPEGTTGDPQSQSQCLEYQVDYYRRYVKSLIESADEESYLWLSQNLYRYRLTVEGEDFPDSGEIVVKSADFTMILSQEFYDIEGLPEDMFILGHITNQNGDYDSHLKLDSPVPYNMFPGSGTTASGYNYYFEGVPEGTVINLTITPELCERLGLPTRHLKIIAAAGT